MEITLRQHSQPGLHTCYVCGAEYRSSGVVADVYNRDELLGNVCPACIDAGPVGIRERLRTRALAMRAQALKLIEEADARQRAAHPAILLPRPDETDACYADIAPIAARTNTTATQQAMRSSRIPPHIDLSALDKAV